MFGLMSNRRRAQRCTVLIPWRNGGNCLGYPVGQHCCAKDRCRDAKAKVAKLGTACLRQSTHMSQGLPSCRRLFASCFARRFLRFLFVACLLLFLFFRLFLVLSFALLWYLPTGTGTGGRANATNLGAFPRLGPRAERISRLMVLALSPLHFTSCPRRLSLLLSHSCRVIPCLGMGLVAIG